ncbi:MAG: hypothetical protein IJP99_08515 [Methanobrevibacter sp.]|nr:hypothetical protein [Methanobrevibacter sp.]
MDDFRQYKDLGVYNDLSEWNQLIHDLSDMDYKLLTLKKYKDSKESYIINNTDFKKIYGANNDKVRKAHVTKKLANTLSLIDDLELTIADKKRRISFLKTSLEVKKELMRLSF